MPRPAVVVREATQADAGAISSLLREAFREFEALYTPEAFVATAQAESGVLARIEEGPVWVAEREQALIGTVAAVRAVDSIVVRGMAVAPSARGLGVGRMLLERTEHFARGLAVQRLSLYTTPFLKQAIRLYQAAGFQFTGEKASPHGTELLRMVKDAAPADYIAGSGQRQLVEQIFHDANFVRGMGIELLAFGHGWCETQLKVSPALYQQHQFVHAGALMTLADHTCGAAARSTVPEDKDVITVENKVSFLRPGSGRVLKCRADVLRAGTSLIFVEAAVMGERNGGPVMVAKASSTLAVIAASRKSRNP